GTFDGGLILQEFEAATDIALPDTGGYETVGGFLMAQLGRIPEAGDRVAVDGGALEVVEVDERRVTTGRFTPVPPGGTDEQAEARADAQLAARAEGRAGARAEPTADGHDGPARWASQALTDRPRSCRVRAGRV